jgi:hypothetical protein
MSETWTNGYIWGCFTGITFMLVVVLTARIGR